LTHTKILVLSISIYGSIFAQSPETNKPASSVPIEPWLTLLSKQAYLNKRSWNFDKLLKSICIQKIDEHEKPLLLEELSKIKKEDWTGVVHPDTAILIILTISKVASQIRPEGSSSSDWMVPLLARIQQIGTDMNGEYLNFGFDHRMPGSHIIKGPNSPTIFFSDQHSIRTDQNHLNFSHPLIPADSFSLDWFRQHSNSNRIPKLAPEVLVASDMQANQEIINWIIARILIARGIGNWDSNSVKRSFLERAQNMIPDWDTFISSKQRIELDNINHQENK